MATHWTHPAATEHPAYYGKYIEKVPAGDLIGILAAQMEATHQLLSSLPAEKLSYRYAEGKWTIPQILLHICDAERVFAYRALRFARKDTTPLPGFDENAYAENDHADERSWQDIQNEWMAVRRATIELLKSFNDAVLDQTGISNNNPVSVRALGYIIAGHELHHRTIIQERYL